MSGQWKEVVKLAFKGPRFRDHALDVTAMGELVQFQKIVSETAKALWRKAHPHRERLPKGFEERTRLCLRRIEEGSAEAPLEVYVEEPEQPELFEQEPTEANEAIALVQDVLRAVEEGRPLPENLRKSLVPEYEQFGETLADDEAIEVRTAANYRARVTSASRAGFAAFLEGTHEGPVEVAGKVGEADVHRERFQLWLDSETCVKASFSPTQEDEVTKALREHRTLRLEVMGRGEFSPTGKLLRITQVEDLRSRPAGELSYDATAPPIEDLLEELAAEVPEEDWQKLPPDLTDNLDHYLYGTPKR